MHINWNKIQTPFSEQSIRQNVPDKAGIFLIAKKEEFLLWKIVRVGMAESLKTEMLSLLQNPSTNKCFLMGENSTQCGYFFTPISNYADRVGVYKFLSDYYLPELKTKVAFDFSLDVNVPIKKTVYTI